MNSTQNLNEIMKHDPSVRQGAFKKVFERKVEVTMMIIEQSILAMVGQQIAHIEQYNFKILVRNSNKRDENGEAIPEVIRLEIMSDSDYFFQYVYE